MSVSESSPSRPGPKKPGISAARVIIVGSVMFSFISYWRVAAVVLCDMASTAFYIGGIVEAMIGPAAPWFILAVMLFSYAVCMLYIESCALFVRGGVYRVVKSALGALPARAAVSALLFDYILTGPISAVSAGQYLMGLALDFVALTNPALRDLDPATRLTIRRMGSVVIAILITLYFFRKNLIGIHESSQKALRIVIFTSIVAITVLLWCGITLAVRGPANTVPVRPDLNKKVQFEVVRQKDRVTGDVRDMWKRDVNGKLVVARDETGEPLPKLSPATGRQEDPLGFLPHLIPSLEHGDRTTSWWSLLGLFGLVVAFGHSVLAMSGEETMAQVYREVESPKLQNFRRSALIIFLYSTILTTSVSFLAVLLIPDEVRMKDYADNLLGGLAMYVLGPPWARLMLNALVVVAGSLILSGAVNTSIIGSNGVLNRVAEDGVIPEVLQKPHPRFGTTYRLLYLVIGLQIFTIIVSAGDMLLLGEAYAFGVLWSFFFNGFSMLVLRFRDKTPREYKVPLNVTIGGVEIPIGLGLIFLVLAATALTNLFTKEIATASGLAFSSLLFILFFTSERMTRASRKGKAHEHIEQVTGEQADEITPESVGATNKYRKLVAIRSPNNLHMLQKALDETDPQTTDVIVMTAKVTPPGSMPTEPSRLDEYDRRLMTAVIERAEKVGKPIKPLVVPTNNPLFAVINTAKSLNAQELVVGASNKYTVEEQLDQMTFYWINLNGGHAEPLTIRILSRTRDFQYDVGGGNRIPKISERKARTVSELRAAGVGVQRVLLAHDTLSSSSDIFESVLTMLDEDVALGLVEVPRPTSAEDETNAAMHIEGDLERARKLGREITLHPVNGDPAESILKLIETHEYDVVFLPPLSAAWSEPLRLHAPCAVCTVTLPAIPREVGDETVPPSL